MRYELVTAAATEPVDLDDAKTHLRVADTAEDQLISNLITAAREYVEAHTARQLVTATWKLHLDGFPSSDILIDKPTVRSIVGITYTDENGDLQTWSSAEYETDLFSTPARVRPGEGYVYPNTLIGKLNSVAVEFTAGYGAAADVPSRAKAAILLLVGHWYENREAVQRGAAMEVPVSAEALIGSLKWSEYHAGVG